MATLEPILSWGGIHLSRRISRSMPLIGALVAVATLGAAMRRKGFVGGLIDAGLNAVPMLGTTKSIAEVVRGRDFVPDRPVANPTENKARSSRVKRNTSRPLDRRRLATGAGIAVLAVALACATGPRHTSDESSGKPRSQPSTAVVTASAFNSDPDQTDGDPFRTASGERLRPGMRVLAVSPDLFDAGLKFGTRVRVEGMDGKWVVLDRMPSDRRRSVDLYFGQDEEAALRFGRKQVHIDWSH